MRPVTCVAAVHMSEIQNTLNHFAVGGSKLLEARVKMQQKYLDQVSVCVDNLNVWTIHFNLRSRLAVI